MTNTSKILLPCEDDDYSGNMLIEFYSHEYEFIDWEDSFSKQVGPVLIFKNISSSLIKYYTNSITMWLKQSYDLERDFDYDISKTFYGATKSRLSIAVWFKDAEHFVILKLQYG